ncbi:MAG: element excision factor XisH family protein [Rhizonema sp. PD37]|nr:element excision factor XisH family protein [Rhizonema sp. PD37]
MAPKTGVGDNPLTEIFKYEVCIFGTSNDVQIQVDLGTERLVATERGDEKIAVEVKSFIASSTISEFYKALG